VKVFPSPSDWNVIVQSGRIGAGDCIGTIRDRKGQKGMRKKAHGMTERKCPLRQCRKFHETAAAVGDLDFDYLIQELVLVLDVCKVVVLPFILLQRVFIVPPGFRWRV
jgi:hypothetical protein